MRANRPLLDGLPRRVIGSFKTSLLAWITTSYAARADFATQVIVGVERHRVWRDEMKLSVLREVDVGGATVTDVACRHDVTRQHIYQWRRQLKDKGLWPVPEGVAFLALDAPDPPLTSKPEPATGALAEIGFVDGRTLRCPPGTAEAEIIQLIRLVETA